MRGKRKRRELKQPAFTVAGIRIREIRPGYFMADFRRMGKAERKCFRSRGEAETWASAKGQEIINRGLDAFRLSDDERRDALRALEILRGSATLAAAAEEYIRRHPLARGESLARLCARYLVDMGRRGCRPISVQEKRQKFRLFCADHGRDASGALDAGMIDEWADAKGYRGTNRENYVGALRSLLNFRDGRQRVKMQRDERLPVTWSADAVSAMFAAAENDPALHPVLPALAVLWFCGLRPHEVLRLTWAHIDLEGRTIRVTPDITKVRAVRNVDIPANAARWIAAYASGAPRPLVSGGPHVFRRLREALMAAAGIKAWPADVSRHTFATAHYGAHQDAAATMAQLGHFESAAIFTRHYKGLMPPAGAAGYWQIIPASGRIIELPRGATA